MKRKNYLKSVRMKRNKTWSESEKKKIYSLRLVKKMSAKEVSRKLKINLIQVYNITRLMKKQVLEQCFVCGKDLTMEEKSQKAKFKACNECKSYLKRYKRWRRRKALRQNLCGYCEIEPVLPGKKACKKCISATYRRRIKEGLCGHCGKKPIKKHGLCDTCAYKNRIGVRLGRLKRKAHYVEQS